jgi:hypothetical protein
VECRPILNAGDLEDLKRAADRLDAEARTWCEGFAVNHGSGWGWDGDYPEIEVRVQKLENSARFLRQIRAKILKRYFGRLPEPPACGNSDTTARNGDRQTERTASDPQYPNTKPSDAEALLCERIREIERRPGGLAKFFEDQSPNKDYTT